MSTPPRRGIPEHRERGVEEEAPSLMRRVGQGLIGGGFRRSVAMVAGGTVLGQIVLVAASPILTRLYPPGDWGVLAVFSSVLSFVYIAGAFRYEFAIPLPEDAREAAAVLVLSVGLVGATAIAAWILLFFFGEWLVTTTGTGALRGWLWLLPLGAVWTGWNKALTYWAIRVKAFPVIARTKVSQGIGEVVSKLGFGLLGWAPGGLLVGDVLGRAAGTGSLALFAVRDTRSHLKHVGLREIGAVARRYRRFPLISTGSGLLNTAGLRLPALLIAAFYGPVVTGWYGLCVSVVGAPVALLGQPVSQVFAGRLAEQVRTPGSDPLRLFRRTLVKLCKIALLPSLAVAIVGPMAFGIAFGEAWHEAGIFVALLAPLLFAQTVAVPLSPTLMIIERQGAQFLWDAGRAVVVVASIWIPFHLGSSPRVAVAIYAGMTSIAYGALLLVSYRALRKAQATAASARPGSAS